MRRSTRLGLVAAALLVLALGGAYTAYWIIAAGQLKDGFAAWAEAMRSQGLDASWQAARVTGYPFTFRLELSEVRLRGTAPPGNFDLHAPVVSGSIATSDFRDWSIAAPQGIDSTLADSRIPLARIAAESATGAVSVTTAGDTTVWLSLDNASAEPTGEPTGRLSAVTANCWVILPSRPARGHDDRSLGFAADLHGVGVPSAPAPFSGKLDDLGFGLTVMGDIPAAPARQAAEAWRRAGGTVELDHLGLDWGNLRITGSGTLALDETLQPVGAFSGAVAGYDQLFAALVKAGRMRQNEAGLAQLALAIFAKPGPDGRPAIETSFTIQNGQMYLGPAKLGPAPRIDWR